MKHLLLAIFTIMVSGGSWSCGNGEQGDYPDQQQDITVNLAMASYQGKCSGLEADRYVLMLTDIEDYGNLRDDRPGHIFSLDIISPPFDSDDCRIGTGDYDASETASPHTILLSSASYYTRAGQSISQRQRITGGRLSVNRTLASYTITGTFVVGSSIQIKIKFSGEIIFPGE